LDEKIAVKASELEFKGTEVVTDMGRWMEKKDATWISVLNKRQNTGERKTKTPRWQKERTNHEDVNVAWKVHWADPRKPHLACST
jgi:hypothetical protein